MHLGHQLWLCGSEVTGKHPMAPEVLLSELSSDPSYSWPLAADATYEEKVQAIKDMCQRHRGEVREISGEWTQVDSPFPDPDIGDTKFFHGQFCWIVEDQKALTPFMKKSKGVGKAVKGKKAAGERGGSWQAAVANTFIRPAPGGDPSKHLLRQARVFGLPELFGNLGTQLTAKVIYEYYLTARIIVHKRLHGRQAQVKRAAAHQRKLKTGCYGFGSW